MIFRDQLSVWKWFVFFHTVILHHTPHWNSCKQKLQSWRCDFVSWGETLLLGSTSQNNIMDYDWHTHTHIYRDQDFLSCILNDEINYYHTKIWSEVLHCLHIIHNPHFICWHHHVFSFIIIILQFTFFSLLLLVFVLFSVFCFVLFSFITPSQFFPECLLFFLFFPPFLLTLLSSYAIRINGWFNIM